MSDNSVLFLTIVFLLTMTCSAFVFGDTMYATAFLVATILAIYNGGSHK